VHAGRPSEGPLSPPVVLASNFRTYGYTREEGSPTWEAFEAAVGALEGGEAVAFGSGMAAIAAVLEPLPVGAKVVGPAVGYTVTRGLLGERAAAGRLELASVDLTDTDAVLRACEGAALLWVETPTNPLVGIAEVDRLCEGAHAAGAAVAVDATFATPLLQRPLELGADLSVASASKLLTGHSDLVLGYVAGSDPEGVAALRAWRSTTGAIPGPFEPWLAHRSLATLAVRLERQEANARALADALRARDEVSDVRWPGVGSVLCFTLRDAERAQAFLAAAALVAEATSFGGLHSSAERRARWGTDAVAEGFIRFSAGIEDTADLVADVSGALDATRAP